jgi:3-oxoacyl-[acyl-carrier-protein] synthase-3
MEDAGVGPEDIDLICVGTTTPDLVFPNVGTLLQDRLGIRNSCPAFSLEAACTGFIYALSVADKFVRLGDAKCALVVGAETLTRITDWSDRGTCVLFGDGAGAVVLKPSPEPGIISTRLHSDGRYKDLLMYPDGVSKGFDLVRKGGNIGVQMKGNEVYKVAVNTLGQLVTETLSANDIEKSQLDWLIPHQANLRIIEAIARRLDLPMERVIVTIADHGNTSAASVPLALDTGYSRRAREARAAVAARGVRRGVHVGIGADSLLASRTVSMRARRRRTQASKKKRRGIAAAFVSLIPSRITSKPTS